MQEVGGGSYESGKHNGSIGGQGMLSFLAPPANTPK